MTAMTWVIAYAGVLTLIGVLITVLRWQPTRPDKAERTRDIHTDLSEDA